jgi:hypothetical protein
MKDINAQIEEMAEKMQKSTTTPKEQLFDVIKSLGKDGLKAKLATLSDEDKVVLKAAIEEMNLQKAVSFDDVYAAKMIRGKVIDSIIQEDIASDDADEKLVKPAANKMNNQGTPTEGWSGQVIKAIEENEDQMDELIEKAMDKCNGDDKMVMNKLKEKGMAEGKVQGALDKYKAKKDMKKSEDLEKGKMKTKMEVEKDEEANKKMKKPGMKKPGIEMEETEAAENDMSAKKKIKTADAKMEKGAALPEKSNPEVDQVGDAPDLQVGGKTSAKKTAAPDIEDNAKANKKNMTKSVSWSDENALLKANTGGRNFNFNVEQFINETIANEPTEPVAKAQAPKEDINDLIQKGMDMPWGKIKDGKDKEEAKKKQNGKMVKSFEDDALAEAMGMTVEEMKKILGE